MTPAAGSGTDRSDEPWTARYEDLRRQVLEEPSLGRTGRGYLLIVRRGLLAWMQAWPRSASTLPPVQTTPPTTPSAPSIPALLRPQLVQILVTTILSNRKEVRV